LKKTIYLIRHGQTDANLEHVYQGVSGDNPLNAEGIRQATLLGLWMEKYLSPPEIILSSPAQRALITAFYIHDAYKGKPLPKRGVFKVEDFHEINHGDWEGKSDSDVAKEYPELYKMWHENPMAVRFPGGESMPEAAKRIFDTWTKEVLKSDEKCLMLVAHAGINFQIINGVLGSEKLRNVHQDNSCLNIIEMNDDGKLRIKLLNSTVHLLEAQK